MKSDPRKDKIPKVTHANLYSQDTSSQCGLTRRRFGLLSLNKILSVMNPTNMNMCNMFSSNNILLILSNSNLTRSISGP